jgi:predicted DNA-binding transcriptional regulator AlpA
MDTQVTQSELFSPQSLARFLGLTESTLYTWRRTGKGPPWFRFETGPVRYRPEDVQAWLDAQQEASS